MTEPLQPRKYLTRARAKAENDIVASNPSGQRKGHAVLSEKRKAIAAGSTLDEVPIKAESNLKPKVARTTRKTPALKADESTLGAGMKVPPKRRSARTGGVDVKRSSPKASKRVRVTRATKKVTFASPQEKQDNKENFAPQRVQGELRENEDDETDILMSTSIGTLSVKPIRIPASKLKQPSASVLDPLPALSPSKVKRLPFRPASPGQNDDDLEDELSSPTSKLSCKPKRAPRSTLLNDSSTLFADAGSSTLLKKPLDLSASLLGSPARRPPASPFKENARSTNPFEVSTAAASNSLFGSPARRPPASLSAEFGVSPVRKQSNLSRPESPFKSSPAKRPKMATLIQSNKDEFSEDELSMSTKPIQKKTPSFRVEADVKKERKVRNRKVKASRRSSPQPSGFDDIVQPTEKQSLTQLELDEIDRKVAALAAPHPILSPQSAISAESSFRFTPPSCEKDDIFPFPKSQNTITPKKRDQSEDADGDIVMDDTEELLFAAQTTPTPTLWQPLSKNKSEDAVGGSNSYGFFGSDDEEEEGKQCGPTCVIPLANKFSGMELQNGRKTLFPSSDSPQSTRVFGTDLGMSPVSCCTPPQEVHANKFNIPIDPMLLAEGIGPLFPVQGVNYNGVSFIESTTRTTTIPVKLPPTEDDTPNPGDQENHRPPSSSKRQAPSKKVSPANKSRRSMSPSDKASSSMRRRSSAVRPLGVLAGAVVFVDVYTTEGADASAGFEETLRELGAKVMKRWDWNPNSNNPSEVNGKVGITHVVFKDGSPRTLQKVKDSDGIVLCVGVAWPVECENEQRWVDESAFAVDLEVVPRGGHRRRKSMEPKALAAMNLEFPPTNLNPYSKTTLGQGPLQLHAPKTPQPANRQFLKPNPCPQTEPPQRNDEIWSNPVLMQRLLTARRKSMQFAPKIGSPLARSFVTASD